MLRYFDKTFFKLAYGFMAIILVSMILFYVGDYYQKKNEKKASLPATSLQMVEEN